MLEFSDQPYRFFPPKYTPLVAWWLKRWNRRAYLPRVKRIAAVEVWGGKELVAGLQPGDRLLFLPNHPTHADAAILLEAMRQIGVCSHIMAAYDVFLRGRLQGWFMQRLGAFSVDREGSDSKGMKQAMATLAEGRFALTIFPEGNVYLENDQVTPFHDGAAFLALKSAQELQGKPGRILAVPVSIKATHVTDARPAITALMYDLARDIEVELPSGVTPLNALKAIGVAALRRNLRHRGIEMPEADANDLRALIEATAGMVVRRLEGKLNLKPRPEDPLVERIRRARRAIHEVRTDDGKAIDHAAAAVWADEAMVAFKVASYSGRYVTQSPTLDRISETTEKLYEDLYNEPMEPVAPRHAYVRFNRPIDLTPFVAGGTKLRAAVRELTAQVEGAVQDGLIQINAHNQHCGAALWNESLGATA